MLPSTEEDEMNVCSKPRLDLRHPPHRRCVIMATSTIHHGHMSQHKVPLGPCTREKENQNSLSVPPGLLPRTARGCTIPLLM